MHLLLLNILKTAMGFYYIEVYDSVKKN